MYTLSLGIYNLGIITNVENNHRNDISMNLSLENNDTSLLGMKGDPGEEKSK